MVVVGGVTGLRTGLSIVEWQPIVALCPPLDETGWQETFGKYKQTPEYRLINPHMTLEIQEHFLVGVCPPAPGQTDRRGIPAAAPVVHAARKNRPRAAWKFAVIFGLGRVAGRAGLVHGEVGLVDNPRVSQYRLTAHLGLAFLIYRRAVGCA